MVATMKSKFLLLISVVVAFAAGLGGGLWWSAARSGAGATLPFLGGAGDASRKAIADMDARVRELEDRLGKLLADNERKDARIKGLVAEQDKLAGRNREMQQEMEKLNQEWTFSYGSTKDAGKFIGSLMKDGLGMRNLDPNDPEAATKMRDMFLKFASLGPILQEMQKIDDKPKEFADFRAAVLGEALGLDDAGRERVSGIVERYKAQALALPEDSEQRLALSQQALDEIRGGLSEDQQGLLEAIPGTRMGGMSDLLETPSLDPEKWRERMRGARPPRGQR